MKCSSRSIKSFVSIGLWLLLLTAPLFGGPTAVDEPSALANAIEAAVRARVGGTSVVSVTNITGVRLVRESSSLVAVPDPSARIGMRSGSSWRPETLAPERESARRPPSFR